MSRIVCDRSERAAAQTDATSRATCEMAEGPSNRFRIGVTFVDMRNLLHVCEAVRPGKYFVKGMLNQLGMPPAKTWHERFRVPRGKTRSSMGRSRVHLSREFHDDLLFGRLMLGQWVRGGLVQWTLRGEVSMAAPLANSHQGCIWGHDWGVVCGDRVVVEDRFR